MSAAASDVALTEALARQAAELEALRRELDETNRGVVALYAELDANAQRLAQATELKSRFLAYMSHEFRTPIASIRSLARLMLERVDGPLTAEQERQIRFIHDTSGEFNDMVNDLLDLAKVEAGRVEISHGWFQLMDLFSALRGMFKPVLTNPDVVLIFEEPQDTERLYSDDKKLAQILRNFISNGLKFTLKGEVRVKASRAGDSGVTFSVSDTGIGIPPQHQDGLFQDYVQLDSPIQRRLRGTGLGLSLSKHLAELLGGRVWMESEVGRGSTFFVEVPMRLRQPPQE